MMRALDICTAPNARSSDYRVPGALPGLVWLGASDGECAVERAGDGSAFDLFDVPVVGEAGPAEDGLDRRGPDVAGLDGLDAAQREHVGEVDEPELVLVDLEPGVRVLAAHVVHRLGVVLDDVRELALPARHKAPRAAKPMLAVSK